MNALCDVEGCTSEVHQNGMCAKHYGRWYRKGHTNLEHAWGEKAKHPRYGGWARLRGAGSLAPVWNDDFWQFLKDTGERPSDKHHLKRTDPKQLLGPNNFYWHQKVLIKEPGESIRDYTLRHTKHRRTLKPEIYEGYRLKTKFGITVADVARMLEEQNHTCRICLRPETLENRSLCIDHDHKTGKVRALLCGACNKALGLLQDDSALMRKAAAYVDEYKD